MAENNKERLPHLLIRDTATTNLYTSPRAGGGKKLRLPARDRQAHGAQLFSELSLANETEQGVVEKQKAFGLDAGYGIYLQFESDPNYELAFESLEFRPSGIELLAVKQVSDRMIATVYVPEGKFAYFLNQVTRYLEKDNKSGKPKNQKLVESISAIKVAALEALWTDDPELFPKDNNPIWWEIWLRVSNEIDFEAFMRAHAQQLQLTVGVEAIHFLDRTILLVHGTKEQISQSAILLGSIAELRKAKDTAEFFINLSPVEQHQWIQEAIQRIQPPSANSPAVCILDTGVNYEHPLIRLATDPQNQHTYDPAWGVNDHHGHGTEMAGFTLYGDLTDVLTSNEKIELKHQLESVKILPPGGANPKHLYGAITAECIARAEISHPNRKRITCMAVTTDGRDRGKPSSWSAEIDALASGADDGEARLIVLSAGNTSTVDRHLYPNSNFTDGIQDPAQAWNALTVGAFTEKVFIDQTQLPGWSVIAPHGDLSPSSCTSAIWKKTWPIKPDIVMEGGNMAINPGAGSADHVASLELLTTGHQVLHKPLVISGETSAAAGLAARLAAILQAEYPDYWPETIRALLVHSSSWTEAMMKRFAPLRSRTAYSGLLRYCGFGSPNIEDLYWSARNSLTLIAQDSLQPYRKDGSAVKTRDINLHEIPWPVDVLENLGETQVEMRVTLSYFVEPNPGERGWARRYRYASHGLRFDVKTPTESIDEFKRRINQVARDEEHGKTSSSDAAKWLLGPDLRGLGSIHSDRWIGTAAELAARGHIAVYPVIGWWRERPHLERWAKRARYALIVSIKTPLVETDIYTPVANMIATQVKV